MNPLQNTGEYLTQRLSSLIFQDAHQTFDFYHVFATCLIARLKGFQGRFVDGNCRTGPIRLTMVRLILLTMMRMPQRRKETCRLTVELTFFLLCSTHIHYGTYIILRHPKLHVYVGCIPVYPCHIIATDNQFTCTTTGIVGR